MNKSIYLLLLVPLLLLLGCKSVGPTTISRDRFDYSASLAESWKHQMLLNLVKTRYLDLPIFLDVSAIVSGYSLQTSLAINGDWATLGNGNSLGIGAAGTFTDRPTITYTPLTGDKFLQGFLTPVPPTKVLSLVQSGYAADFILELSLDSLNGIRNRPVSLGSTHKADPEFFRVLALMREIQDAGAVGMRIDQPTNEHPAAVLFFRDERTSPEVEAKIMEVRKILGLPDDSSQFRLVHSPLRGRPGELGISTRSLSQILAFLSLGVDVPPAHSLRHLTPPVPELPSDVPPLLRIHSGSSRPDNAFVSVPYLGEWFWIANDDWRSKRTFSSILFLFTLTDSGSGDRLPILTIPTQ